MKKVLLVAALICISGTAAFAQRDKSGVEYQRLRGPFLTNGFWDNWFISVGAGANTWLRPSTVEWEEYKGFDQASYMLQVGLGKMLNPYYGVRGQINYGDIKTKTSLPGMYTRFSTQDREGRHDLNFQYWSVEADFLFHFSNAVCGYKEARFYNALLFAGMGYAKSMGDNFNEIRSTDGQLAFNFGLLNTFRLAPALDLYVEAKFNLMDQSFSAKSMLQDDYYFTGASGVGMIPSLTFGLTYKFRDRRFHKPETCDYGPLERHIGQLERDLAASQALLKRCREEAEAAPEHVCEAPQIVCPQTPMAVFFRRGEAVLNRFDMLNVKHVADAILQDPDTERVYTLVGLADRQTGTPEYNQRLSERRVRFVREALISMGVSAGRLETKALGDTENPFEVNEMNRVVIVE